MNDAPTPAGEPAGLKFLRILVTILTASMIAGLVAIIVLIVIRFPHVVNLGEADLPEAIILPDGTTATAFTQGEEWYAVVTANDEILIFDRATGQLIQRVEIEN